MNVNLIRDDEQFTFDSSNYPDPYPEILTDLDSTHNFTTHEVYEWNPDIPNNEKEINGDFSLVPMYNINLTDWNDSTPSEDDFHKVMNDYNQLIKEHSSCTDFVPIVPTEEDEDELASQSSDFLSLPDIRHFDLNNYITEPSTSQTVLARKPKAGNENINSIAQQSSCTDFESILPTEEHEDEVAFQQSTDILNLADIQNFDLTTYITYSDQSEPSIRKSKDDVKKIDFKAPQFSCTDLVPTEDLSTHITNQSEPTKSQTISEKKPRAAVKKIDLEAQRYILDDEQDEIDIETVSDNGENSPVLEAGDIESLLEQFEATQLPLFPVEFIENDTSLLDSLHILQDDILQLNNCINEDGVGSMPERVSVKEECTKGNAQTQQIDAEIKSNSRKDKAGLKPKDKSRSKEEFRQNISELKYQKHVEVPAVAKQTSVVKQSPIPDPEAKKRHFEKPCVLPEPLHPKNASLPGPSNTSQASKTLVIKKLDTITSFTPPALTKNKQIADSLPAELIDRIKQSCKRKTISVIDPVPVKKRRAQQDCPATAKPARPLGSLENVRLDHDYCMYRKRLNKDSGFGSADEDERLVMGKQPVVQNADGKMMVSLLKVNSIHNNDGTKKKRLNLEEYKKRQQGSLNSNSSQSCSPNSNPSSPPEPEDENTRILKHQQKLKRMAMEVLNTPPPKAVKKPAASLVITLPKPVVVPPHLEMKILVSVGVNTDFKGCGRDLDPLAPVEQLNEIKPLLQKVSKKINANSLITSVIENIPKVIDSCEVRDRAKCEPRRGGPGQEHGEDKTIVHLPKDRKQVRTSTVGCQTKISLIEQTKASRSRRRSRSRSSSPSCRSGKSNRSSSRNRSRTRSRSSGSSSKSSRSCSPGYRARYSGRPFPRSRSPPPRYKRTEMERHLEVEERRVVYVGNVPPYITKEDLRSRFYRFGPITNVSLHWREHEYMHSYGFVTFANQLDAFEALAHGNDDPWMPKFELSFGGRRIFCQNTYSDLDKMPDEHGYYQQQGPNRETFDKILKDMLDNLA